jgi:hypothetical protein
MSVMYVPNEVIHHVILPLTAFSDFAFTAVQKKK